MRVPTEIIPQTVKKNKYVVSLLASHFRVFIAAMLDPTNLNDLDKTSRSRFQIIVSLGRKSVGTLHSYTYNNTTK